MPKWIPEGSPLEPLDNAKDAIDPRNWLKPKVENTDPYKALRKTEQETLNVNVLGTDINPRSITFKSQSMAKGAGTKTREAAGNLFGIFKSLVLIILGLIILDALSEENDR